MGEYSDAVSDALRSVRRKLGRGEVGERVRGYGDMGSLLRRIRLSTVQALAFISDASAVQCLYHSVLSSFPSSLLSSARNSSSSPKTSSSGITSTSSSIISRDARFFFNTYSPTHKTANITSPLTERTMSVLHAVGSVLEHKLMLARSDVECYQRLVQHCLFLEPLPRQHRPSIRRRRVSL